MSTTPSEKKLGDYLASPTGRTIWLSPHEVFETKVLSECGTAALCENCHHECAVKATRCDYCHRRFSNS